MKKIVALLSLTRSANFSESQPNGFKKVPNVDPNVMYTFKTNPTADVLYRINISKFDNELDYFANIDLTKNLPDEHSSTYPRVDYKELLDLLNLNLSTTEKKVKDNKNLACEVVGQMRITGTFTDEGLDAFRFPETINIDITKATRLGEPQISCKKSK